MQEFLQWIGNCDDSYSLVELKLVKICFRDSNPAQCNSTIAMQNHGIGDKRWLIANLSVSFSRRDTYLPSSHILNTSIVCLQNILVTLFSCSDELVDVESLVPSKTVPILNKEITIQNFEESEQKLNLITAEENSADWEETVKRDGWTPLQHRIFNKVYHMNMLQVVELNNSMVIYRL